MLPYLVMLLTLVEEYVNNLFQKCFGNVAKIVKFMILKEVEEEQSFLLHLFTS